MRESRHKRLTRLSKGQVIAGVFSGLGNYLHCSPTILRVAYSILTVLTGMIPGIIIYIILVIMIPADPEHPGILGFFQGLNKLSQGQGAAPHSRSRRQLTDVEEKDIKKNGRS